MSAAHQPETAGRACFEELGLDYDPVQVSSELILLEVIYLLVNSSTKTTLLKGNFDYVAAL